MKKCHKARGGYGVDYEKRVHVRVIQEHLRKGPVEHCYSYGFLSELFNNVIEVLETTEPVEYIMAPINICGDIRGRYADLLDIFNKCGYPFDTKYLFLGNFLDAGRYSLETCVLLFTCKVAYPENFVILRGYLENIILNDEQNFFGELRVKYPDSNEWKCLGSLIRKILTKLPVCAVLNEKILCINSSFSTTITDEKTAVSVKSGGTLEIKTTNIEVMFETMDMPATVTPKKIEEETQKLGEMLKTMDMAMMINSNNVVKNGYQFQYNHYQLTITSGSKIAKNVNNRGAVMMMNNVKKVHFIPINGGNAKENSHGTEMYLRC